MVEDLDCAFRIVKSDHKPLTPYAFRNKQETIERNIFRLYMMTPWYISLPFGGVSESEIRANHGKHSVDTFSVSSCCPVLKGSAVNAIQVVQSGASATGNVSFPKPISYILPL